jgi:hypothetical protein
MNHVLIYRQMAAKWLEIAEHTSNAGLKRCYMRRAMAYRALAASSQKRKLAAERPGRSDLGCTPR